MLKSRLEQGKVPVTSWGTAFASGIGENLPRSALQHHLQNRRQCFSFVGYTRGACYTADEQRSKRGLPNVCACCLTAVGYSRNCQPASSMSCEGLDLPPQSNEHKNCLQNQNQKLQLRRQTGQEAFIDSRETLLKHMYIHTAASYYYI